MIFVCLLVLVDHGLTRERGSEAGVVCVCVCVCVCLVGGGGAVRAYPVRTYISLSAVCYHELPERILTRPEIRREIATEYVQELWLVREPGMKRVLGFFPLQMIVPALSLANGVSRDNESPRVEKMESEDIVEEKPKVRRDIVYSILEQPIVVARPVAANRTRAWRVRGGS